MPTMPRAQPAAMAARPARIDGPKKDKYSKKAARSLAGSLFCTRKITFDKNKSLTKERFFREAFWQGQKDSNPRHAVLETAALPAELYP